MIYTDDQTWRTDCKKDNGGCKPIFLLMSYKHIQGICTDSDIFLIVLHKPFLHQVALSNYRTSQQSDSIRHKYVAVADSAVDNDCGEHNVQIHQDQLIMLNKRRKMLTVLVRCSEAGT